jgi:uncharacterized protein (DUF885 family)
MKLCILVLMCVATVVCRAGESRDAYQELIDNPKHLSDADRLHQLFDIDWKRGLRESPEFGTDVGYPGSDDHLTDMSVGAIAQRKVETQWPLDVLNAIKRDALSPADQLNYDLFRHDVDDAVEGNKFPGEDLAVSQLGGVQQTIPGTIEQMPHGTVKQYENILARLRAAPALIDQNIILLQNGVAAGITEPKIILRNVPAQVLAVAPEDPAASTMLKPFADFPQTMAQADRDRLKAEATKIYKEQVTPAYHKLHDFLVQDYIPKCRDAIAWAALPQGAEWYRHAVRVHTTTDMTPDEIHDLGLREVKRIHAEMEDVAASAGYAGRLDDFINFLRTDPQFYYKDADSLVSGFRDLAKQIDPVLPQYFHKLPRLTYGVKPIPAYAADSAPAAYYQSGSVATGRPGWFTANTSNLASRPKWQMPVLTLHESVPGHHLQLSLAQEMEDVPQFRRFSGYTAFVEGWALYCEHLGIEMGFYKDPYTKFGQLSFDMWRACRLVVDTGMHAQGWTRQQAIDYLMANAGKDEHEATVEIDRYIASPGQALAYKIGQLKILEIRDEATRELGDKFDLAAFHDALLSHGALPLPILDEQMKEWIASQKNTNHD